MYDCIWEQNQGQDKLIFYQLKNLPHPGKYQIISWDYQDEANLLIEKKLTYPALDYVLKCSHTFNLLDARGVISVTDRAQYIEKIRNLAREVASTWVSERQLLDYPLIKK